MNESYWFKVGLSTSLVVLMAFSLFAQDKERFEAGLDYLVLEKELSAPDSEEIRVVEYFSYECVHCFRFEKHIGDWLENTRDDVTFSREAVVMRESAIPYARVYYSAEALEVTDKIHKPMFRAIHTEKTPMRSDDALVTLFAETAEVSQEEFLDVFYSDEVNDRIMATHEDFKIVSKASVPSTPQVLVDNRFVITTRTAGSQARIFKIVDFLIDKIRTENESTRPVELDPTL